MLLGTPCVACAADRGPVCPACAAGLQPVGELAVAGLDRVWALMAYEGTARDLVHALKFRNRRGALGVLATAAARLVAERPDAVTWVPAEPTHRRERGFDQGQLLARRVAIRLGVPARRLLARDGGRPQTGLDRVHRLDGPRLRPRSGAPATVLVVDDVVTTGASLTAAAAAVRAAGAERVLALVLAANL